MGRCRWREGLSAEDFGGPFRLALPHGHEVPEHVGEARAVLRRVPIAGGLVDVVCLLFEVADVRSSKFDIMLEDLQALLRLDLVERGDFEGKELAVLPRARRGVRS